jgi:ribosomal protein S18 acetylase RimI-like enzyme
MKTVRPAVAADIDELIRIRAAVRENRLREPGSVTRADYDWFVSRGLVWVCESAGQVAGFSAGDPRDGTIWALFVDPDCEGRGLGAELLDRACADLKAGGFSTVTLSTDPGTKAARLYQRLGWRDEGLLPDGEVRFAREV